MKKMLWTDKKHALDTQKGSSCCGTILWYPHSNSQLSWNSRKHWSCDELRYKPLHRAPSELLKQESRNKWTLNFPSLCGKAKWNSQLTSLHRKRRIACGHKRTYDPAKIWYYCRFRLESSTHVQKSARKYCIRGHQEFHSSKTGGKSWRQTLRIRKFGQIYF